MMNKTILVDMDDTATWLLPHWVEWLNKRYSLNVDWKGINKWDILLFFPKELTKEQIYEPLISKEFWDSVTPREGAVEYITKLHNAGFEIYICTSTDYRNIQSKYERVIRKYFPFIDWKHIIVTSNKQMIKADFIIDDAIHNLIGGCQRYKILMAMPHNDNFEVNEFGINRMSNWKTIYFYIRYITLRRVEK